MSIIRVFSNFLQMESCKIKALLWTTCLLIILIYASIHLCIINKTAIDIPYWDEWELFKPKGITLGWSKDYILDFQNEHRVVATKTLFLLNYYLFDLNFRYQIIFNSFLYFCLVFMVWRILVCSVGLGRSFSTLLALTLFLSTLLNVIHTMAYLADMHVCMFSFFIGTYLVFLKEKWLTLFLGLLLWSLSMFNFAGAVLGVLVTCLFYVTWVMILQKENRILKSLLALLVVGFSIYMWFQGYHRNPAHPNYIMPWKLTFLRYFAELVSLGFGFTNVHPVIAYLCLFMVSFVLMNVVFQSFKKKLKNSYIGFVIALTLGILAMLALISFGRAGFPLSTAKASRYSEVPIFLPLLTLILLRVDKGLLRIKNILICGILLIGLPENFGFHAYHTIRQNRLEGKRCINHFLDLPQVPPKASCPTLYPGNLTERLNKAKQLRVNFTKR